MWYWDTLVASEPSFSQMTESKLEVIISFDSQHRQEQPWISLRTTCLLQLATSLRLDRLGLSFNDQNAASGY
jgi:hypothetical protein